MVPFTLRVENAGEQPLDLYLRGRVLTFDIVVMSADGRPVWRRLANEVIPAILQLRVLAPGEMLEMRARWDQRDSRGTRVDVGAYQARAAVLTDADPLETEAVPLRIVAS
jgi:hypothetical protein